jgi:hypothetical protein
MYSIYGELLSIANIDSAVDQLFRAYLDMKLIEIAELATEPVQSARDRVALAEQQALLAADTSMVTTRDFDGANAEIEEAGKRVATATEAAKNAKTKLDAAQNDGDKAAAESELSHADATVQSANEKLTAAQAKLPPLEDLARRAKDFVQTSTDEQKAAAGFLTETEASRAGGPIRSAFYWREVNEFRRKNLDPFTLRVGQLILSADDLKTAQAAQKKADSAEKFQHVRSYLYWFDARAKFWAETRVDSKLRPLLVPSASLEDLAQNAEALKRRLDRLKSAGLVVEGDLSTSIKAVALLGHITA